MLDDEQIAMLVYNHVVQLSLIDYGVDEAFRLAHEVAARAFDPAYTRDGIDAARRRSDGIDDAAEAATASP